MEATGEIILLDCYQVSRHVLVRLGSNFGTISKCQPMMFGAGSVFAGKKNEKKESISRTASSSNMFSMLNTEIVEPTIKNIV